MKYSSSLFFGCFLMVLVCAGSALEFGDQGAGLGQPCVRVWGGRFCRIGLFCDKHSETGLMDFGRCTSCKSNNNACLSGSECCSGICAFFCIPLDDSSKFAEDAVNEATTESALKGTNQQVPVETETTPMA